MSDTMLAAIVARLSPEPGEEERRIARILLLDWLACLAGARTHEAGALGGAISSAAWEKATYPGNALGLSDRHPASGISPGPFIWPAAISLPSAGMQQRLDAAIRGYEASIAIAALFDGRDTGSWNVSAAAGMFGTAAAFGSLIGFAGIEYRNALGNVAAVAGLLAPARTRDVLTEQWQTYHAVRTGRDAALHVHYGATGSDTLLDGEFGLIAAMSGSEEALPETISDWAIAGVGVLPVMALQDAENLADRPDAASVSDKVRHLTKFGELPDEEADKAIGLALESDDVAALDNLLQRWLS
ncbi:hypothetical protein GRI38_11935 [Altererythrobacter aurantiacus]|uniref:MmgE/PrpD N-terminal domain-containing protein n=1 Tax=Parapontixanthobacter aurantiacus TaxID=1463599 RepID=A0A844ZFV2_9SPHN|nr:MmgE/PrpD family protein [Parapontixanthobacter aurantiacus]MXO86735.1 hypothetical protein [Parapontixanthobacter aurantiacus]